MLGTAAGGGLITLMLSVPAIGYLLSPLFARKRTAWVTVGTVDDIPVATPTPLVVDMPTGVGWETPPERRVVYVVRRQDGTVLALSNVCSHMQCDVHWDRSLHQFLCPCHGGLYDMDGRNIGGPPPSPLPQWVHRFTTDSEGRRVLEVQNQFDESI